MPNIAIIGGGKWGFALAFALQETVNKKQKTDTKINLYSRNPAKATCTLAQALACKYIIMAIGAQYTQDFLQQHFINQQQKILVTSKGIHIKSQAFLDQLYNQYIDQDQLCILSGPSFAAEVMQKLPTALVLSSTDANLAQDFAELFPRFIKTYISDDVRGVQVGGAYKNVIAIAAGICQGLKLGQNAKYALMTRGLAEMRRFGLKFGAHEQTFLGLSGAGDLFLTGSSELSRNFTAGFMLACGKSTAQISQELGELAEGISTCQAIVKMAKTNNIYTPIAQEVLNIINGKDIKQRFKLLLNTNNIREF